MRVQFIWPNFDCPIGINIGVAYLSGALKHAGHDTRILHINERLDYPLDPDRIESDVRDFGPDLIAVSVAANYYPDMRRVGEKLKRSLGCPVIFGGIHVTLNAREVMAENPWLDYANVGEGDDSLPELVSALEHGRDATGIPNVWARTNGRVISNPVRPLKDITRVPWMDLEGWEFRRITELKRGWANVMMNRGCPYRCSYCHNNGVVKVLQDDYGARSSSNSALGYLRYRGIDDMIGELRDIVERFPFVGSFCFCDDTFTMNQPYTRSFLERYRDEIGLPFVCMTTVMDTDDETLALLKEAGCDQLRFGVESASPRIRKTVIRRNFPNRRIESVFGKCHQLGLRTFAYNMLANPSETREEMLETLRLNARIRTDGIRPSLGHPYPGTEYHQIAEDMGAIDDARHVHSYLYESTLRWSGEDRLWIDKLRTFYWWWMNGFLENECSAHYAELVKMLEAMPGESWRDPVTRRLLAELDTSMSRMLRQQGIRHYHSPFEDRHDIAFYYQPGAGETEDVPHR